MNANNETFAESFEHVAAAAVRPFLKSRRVYVEGSRAEALRLYFLRPERRWLFGLEQFTPQSGRALAAGARVWLY